MFFEANARFGRNVKKTASKKIPWYLFIRECAVKIMANKAVRILNLVGGFAFNFKDKEKK